MNRTSIEWVKNPDGTPGFTWNPIVGCSRGCSYCYARRIATTRLAHTCAKCATFEPHLHPERLEQPSQRKFPTGIFVCSMGELYDPVLSWSAICRVHVEIERNRQHRFYILTKRPGFAIAPLENTWLGVSCDCQNSEADCQKIERLAPIFTSNKGRRFVSFEPLLSTWIEPRGRILPWIDWIIIGAQTGPKHEIMAAHKRHPQMTPVPWRNAWTLQPPTEWVRGIIKTANEDNIPVFLKNNLLEARDDLPRRQEAPE